MREYSRFFAHIHSAGLREQDALGRMQNAAWQPPIDVYERESDIIVLVEIPGVREGQVHVMVKQGVLDITGARTKQVPPDTLHVHQMEIPYGDFARTLRLPEEADAEHIEAQYDCGYLTIRIPRKTST